MDAWFPWFAGVTILVQIWIVFTINANEALPLTDEACFGCGSLW
jgi:hypothetical protein